MWLQGPVSEMARSMVFGIVHGGGHDVGERCSQPVVEPDGTTVVGVEDRPGPRPDPSKDPRRVPRQQDVRLRVADQPAQPDHPLQQLGRVSDPGPLSGSL